MSILTELMHGKITWRTAADQAGGWASSVVAHDPILAQAAGDTLSIVKQGASNAIALADTALAAHLAPAADAVELALDAALASATGGLSIPFNPLIDEGIDRIAGIALAAAHAWALQAKARLAAPAATLGS